MLCLPASPLPHSTGIDETAPAVTIPAKAGSVFPGATSSAKRADSLLDAVTIRATEKWPSG
jgi:hypothetical protein